MRVIAVVEDVQGYNRIVRVVPDGVTYELLGPQYAPGTHVTLALTGLADLSDSAMTRWLEVHHHSGEHRVPTELFADDYRVATLLDFVEAANAQDYAARVPALFSAEALAQLANAQGAEMLGLVRAALDGDPAGAGAAAIGARARGLARVLGVERADDVCDELARLHDVEHLMGLEHAIGQWVAAVARPRADALAQLAAAPPADGASAGISGVWYRWWWSLAWAVTRGPLMRAVAAVVDAAEAACAARKPPVAAEARTEAARMVARMREATHTVAWAMPVVPDADPTEHRPDHERTSDVHACAFAAVSHAAHAVAFGLTVDGLAYPEAMRRAMRQLADVAIRAIA